MALRPESSLVMAELPPAAVAATADPRAAANAELQRALAEQDLLREMLREGVDAATARRLAHVLTH